MKKAIFSKLWVLALLGLDATTKAFALQAIPFLQGLAYPFDGIAVFENFCGVSLSLNTVVNTGIAWGIFPHHFLFLLILRICVVASLLWVLFFSSSAVRIQFPLWLIATGAIGNIIDMLYYGHVIDFLHVQICGWSFPIFNIADSCITCGVVLLLFWPNRGKRRTVDAD